MVGFEIGLRPELRHHGAVDYYPAFDNQLLGVASRCNAGLRENFLQPFLGHQDSCSCVADSDSAAGGAVGSGVATSLSAKAIRRMSSNSFSDGSSLTSF